MLGNDYEVRVGKTGRRAVSALSDFMPGEVICTWDASNTFTDAEYEALAPEQRAFVRAFEGQWTFMTDPICYVQHSTNPNVGSRRGTVIAIKEIHIGEEITINFEHPDA